MNRFIEVNLERCTACRLCEFACSTHHFGEINPAKARIRVNIVSKDFFYYPNVCRQCGNAPCIESCPKEALFRDAVTDAVRVNADHCIGCRMCIRACPFGAMGYIRENKLADKCDLCGGDPECVKHCFYDALAFKTPDQTVEEVSFAYTEKLKTAYLEEVAR